MKDWKEKLKNYINDLPDIPANVKTYDESYQKLVDAGDGAMVQKKGVKIIEVWFI